MDGVNMNRLFREYVLFDWLLEVKLLLAGALFSVFFLQLVSLSKKKLRRWRLPPGPYPMPIVGNLLQVGPLPHIKMMEMNKKYGPLVFLKMGVISAVVTDDLDMVREFLKTKDHIFASRPVNIASQVFTYGGRDIAFAPYGHHWRTMRKICTLELLTPKRIESFQRGRNEEIDCMVLSVLEDSKIGKLIDLRSKFGGLSSNNLTRMLLGKRFFGPGDATPEEAAEHKETIYEAFSLINAFNIADYLPYLRWMDIQGHERGMRKIMQRTNRVYDAIIEEHRQKHKTEGNENPHDFVDVLLSLPGENGEDHLDNTTIKAILIDMMAAGTDTSSITSEWAMAELMQHPDIFKKVREEIDSVVGLNRVVEETDITHFSYLRSVVKETFRVHPVGAFLIPHVARENTKVAGFDIPKNTRILINTYALGRNPKIWKDPLEFKPERFAEDHNDLFDPELRIVPFGAGRRGCPGAALGTCMVLLGVSRLIHAFDWSPPPGKSAQDIDMTWAYNSMVLNKSLQLLATPRLAGHLYHQTR